MSQRIRMILNDGSAIRTTRVEASNVKLHIEANDALADEARALRDFAASDHIPQELPGGWKQVCVAFDEVVYSR